jgi:hypothetical protein
MAEVSPHREARQPKPDVFWTAFQNATVCGIDCKHSYHSRDEAEGCTGGGS